jgi:signal transduction histidine kinase/CheY-like chemotaxis protein
LTSAAQLEERFLVLAPTGRDAALTCRLLERAGLCSATCSSIEELCKCFEEDGAAALLIAEEVFVRSGVERMCSMLSKQSAWSDVPIVIFTGNAASGGVRRGTPDELSAIGNVILLERPLQPISMLSAARSALRARRRQYGARAELVAQQRAVRERDQFLAMLGHELRNPLSAISMAINLESDGQRSSKHRDIVRRQLGHLTRLVDDLLDVARVTSGKIALRREPLELVSLTERCLNVLASNVNGSLTLALADAPAELWVAADPVRVEQIINNLLNNAVKYTDSGGKIEVRLSAEGGDAVLRVRDTGVGLTEDMVERVFELFTQVESSLDRAHGGMGIGLTLVKTLVELHGGSVKAVSAGLGRGSEFSVRLPRADHAAAVSGQAARPAPTNGHPVRSRSVLIVEDNEDSRELLAAILTTRGYGVFTADNGLRGVEEALAHRPDVLLVDIGLPGLDGYGLAREVRKQLGHDVYMVAITGYGQPEDRVRAVEAGFDVHLTKPVDIGTLEELLADGTHAPPVRPNA